MPGPLMSEAWRNDRKTPKRRHPTSPSWVCPDRRVRGGPRLLPPAFPDVCGFLQGACGALQTGNRHLQVGEPVPTAGSSPAPTSSSAGLVASFLLLLLSRSGHQLPPTSQSGRVPRAASLQQTRGCWCRCAHLPDGNSEAQRAEHLAQVTQLGPEPIEVRSPSPWGPQGRSLFTGASLWALSGCRPSVQGPPVPVAATSASPSAAAGRQIQHALQWGTEPRQEPPPRVWGQNPSRWLLPGQRGQEG